MVRRDLFRDTGRRHRQGHPAAAPLGGDQVEHHQQRAVVLDDPAPFVDERQPLADRVEAHAEGRTRRRHDLAQPTSPDAAVVGGLGGPRLVETRD